MTDSECRPGMYVRGAAPSLHEFVYRLVNRVSVRYWKAEIIRLPESYKLRRVGEFVDNCDVARCERCPDEFDYWVNAVREGKFA